MVVDSVYFETERLYVREAEMRDAEALFAIFSDENVLYYNCMEPPSMERIRARLERGEGGLVIVLKEEDKVIGTIGLEEDDLRWKVDSKSINYELLSAYTGKGYMSEALHRFLGYCFDECRLDMVSARVFAGNQRSERLLSRLGFVKEGCLRRAVMTPQGNVFDDSLFSLLKEEYKR